MEAIRELIGSGGNVLPSTLPTKHILSRNRPRGMYERTKKIKPAKPKKFTNPLTRLKVRRAAKPYRWGLKLEMIAAYGGKCACCSEGIPHFLSLEHIAGDGAEHRRKVGNNAQAQLVDLKRRGWPQEGYTVLCLNCNISKGAFGQCPHTMDEYKRTPIRRHKLHYPGCGCE